MTTAKPENSKALPKPVDYPLHQLYFYLTGACNLRCRHCWIEPRYFSAGGAFPALDSEVFQRVIDEGLPLGLKGVKLTGGEPLLHPEIDCLIEIVRDRQICLSVETNGTLCTPELARKIAECKNAFVSVSLDGCDAATHEAIRGRKGCFQESLSGINHLVKAGISPQIIMTIMRSNKDQMAAMVRLAKTLGAGSVKFNVLQPTARGLKMHEAGETLSIAELISIGKWVDGELSSRTTLPLCFHQPPAFRGLGKMFGETGDGCYQCGILGILGVLSDGSYALCGIGELLPELVFGQAGRDTLDGVWHRHPLLRALREGLPGRLKGVCSLCTMKQICLGSCIAQNLYRARDLWAPFWFCEEARRQDLFPKSRLLQAAVS